MARDTAIAFAFECTLDAEPLAPADELPLA
jgi:hypothetical protein